MIPKIYHETIDKRFIEYLESIGINDFLSQFDLDRKCSKEFYIDLYFNERFDFLFPNTKDAVWRLEVQFEVEFDEYFTFSKDREFNMINLKTGAVISCSPDCHDFNVINCNPNYKGLDYECNKWYDHATKNN